MVYQSARCILCAVTWFQPSDINTLGFTPFGLAGVPMVGEVSPPRLDAFIEIKIENGCKLSKSDGVNAVFVLQLARVLKKIVPMLTDAMIWLEAGVTDTSL